METSVQSKANAVLHAAYLGSWTSYMTECSTCRQQSARCYTDLSMTSVFQELELELHSEANSECHTAHQMWNLTVIAWSWNTFFAAELWLLSAAAINCQMRLTSVDTVDERQVCNAAAMCHGWKLLLQRSVYFNGINLDEWVAPMPGFPCLTGL